MGPRIHVIADDLTGAADTGAAFAERGLVTRLLLEPGSPTADTADVVVHDTGSRDAAVQEAIAASTQAAQRLSPGATALKKIDSLLRGHLTDETTAVRRVLHPDLVIVAPALPSMGRTTVGGVTLVDGVALHETTLWALEPTPPPHSVLETFPGQLVPLSSVRGPHAELCSRLAVIAARGDVAVCDAVTAADLDRIVAAGRAVTGRVLWVGAGGLGSAIARSLRNGRKPDPEPPRGRFLAIVGSADPVAHQQADAVQQHGVPGIVVEAGRLTDPAYFDHTSGAITSAAAEGSLVVRLSSAISDEHLATAARSLGDCVVVAARAATVLALVGGATAHAVLRARGVTSLILTGQAEPGVAVGVPDDDPHSLVLTKAGSFGDPGTLARVLVHSSTNDPSTAHVPSRKAAT